MPVYRGVSRVVGFDMLTTAGAADTTNAPTVQVSKDGGAFAPTTNAAARIGATNAFALTLTATEMTADLVVVQATATGDVPRTLMLFTESDYTSARSVKLDNLDATVSSRSTYAGTDTSGTTTLLSRVPNTLPSFPSNFAAFSIDGSGRVTVISNADKTGYTVSTVSDKTGYSLSASQTFNLTGNVTGNLSGAVGSVTGAVGSVTGNVGGNVVGSVASVTGSVGSVTAAVTAGTVSDKTGYSGAATNLPADYLSTAEQTFLSRLDATVSSRMATFTYTAPTNPTDYAKSNIAPSWWVSPDNADVATALGDLVTLVARADPATALSTLQTAANAIKVKTDLLSFTGSNVNAAISGDATTILYGDAGAIAYTYTVYDVGGVTPLPGAAVYVSADSGGAHPSQTKVTDSLGRVTFQLDAGTVYFWMSHPDRTFSGNPVTEVVS